MRRKCKDWMFVMELEQMVFLFWKRLPVGGPSTGCGMVGSEPLSSRSTACIYTRKNEVDKQTQQLNR